VQLIALIYKDQHVSNLQKLLNLWIESSMSESSEDNESNTSPPDQGVSCDSYSPNITSSDPTSDSSDNGNNNNNNKKMNTTTTESSNNGIGTRSHYSDKLIIPHACASMNAQQSGSGFVNSLSDSLGNPGGLASSQALLTAKPSSSKTGSIPPNGTSHGYTQHTLDEKVVVKREPNVATMTSCGMTMTSSTNSTMATGYHKCYSKAKPKIKGKLGAMSVKEKLSDADSGIFSSSQQTNQSGENLNVRLIHLLIQACLNMKK